MIGDSLENCHQPIAGRSGHVTAGWTRAWRLAPEDVLLAIHSATVWHNEEARRWTIARRSQMAQVGKCSRAGDGRWCAFDRCYPF